MTNTKQTTNLKGTTASVTIKTGEYVYSPRQKKKFFNTIAKKREKNKAQNSLARIGYFKK